MASALGALGDEAALSARARAYANEVVFGEAWPLTPDHVDLARVTYETSTRMQRKHGVCSANGDGTCTVRLSQKTHDRAGFEALEETIRHELVHAHQHQSPAIEMGHGDSFQRWVDRLELAGRCSQHYEVDPGEYAYTFHCEGCGFIGGRYRLCKTVRAGFDGRLSCQRCGSQAVEVRGEDGTVADEQSGR